MKIKKLPNSKRVNVELEEFYTIADDKKALVITELCEKFNGRRTSYNMWEFGNISIAEEFIFMYNLKYATST